MKTINFSSFVWHKKTMYRVQKIYKTSNISHVHLFKIMLLSEFVRELIPTFLLQQCIWSGANATVMTYRWSLDCLRSVYPWPFHNMFGINMKDEKSKLSLMYIIVLWRNFLFLNDISKKMVCLSWDTLYIQGFI